MSTSIPPSADTGDEANVSSSEYARRGKELMSLLNDLRTTGANVYLEIPAIVVIGGQSAGKSSLVEAVSGINVPRDSGTCTRCPMECTMSSEGPSWSCKITLHSDYDVQNQRLDRSTDVSFGPTLTNKEDVEVWLRRAQAAILNPDISSDTFHTKSLLELKTFKRTLQFSKNVVRVHIRDPEATDLSFYDLPGLIQNEEEDVIDIVRGLVESYIKQKNTLILTTIPMSDDMENQQSMKLAKMADPDGKRIIGTHSNAGVLTKPDMLTAGSSGALQRWRNLLDGRLGDNQEKHRLKHGYYCVRLPDDEDRARRLSRIQCQQREEQFFDETPPWCEVQDRGRFGIPAFVADISQLLIQLIEDTLPEHKRTVEKLLADCTKELESLPPPLVSDPKIEVLMRVNAFCESFKGAVDGSSDKTLAQRNRALYSQFKRDIRGTAPDFRPFSDPQDYTRIEPDHEDWESPDDYVPNPNVQTMGLQEVKEFLRSIGWELPNNIPFEAKKVLIHQFLDLWMEPTTRCFDSINIVLSEVVDTLVKAHFGRFKALQEYMDILVREMVDACKDQARVAVRKTLELEMLPYFTKNTHYLQSLQKKWYKRFLEARRNPEAYIASENSVHFQERVYSGYSREDRSERPVDKALRFLAQAGYGNLVEKDLVRLLPPDQFQDELVVMADVRAYFNVSYKRVIDYIPLKIEHCLHQTLASEFSKGLLTRLMEPDSAPIHPALLNL
ncbi:P-loop containing nucleoside triphosphate hydrolase protein [Hygrophoropsis aurantiaca]|uniref:P-loop containing nucleoside triphosphate hydrolase protein n=1 Tax=Hygrophoropsis aurantiaca TaxID=72124 RepID=A0ACB8A7Q5_9AGAM|nr:P-loop containing nucleoside triphosphate hydrolase protein [Hygrophoropsis aurantiaca]